MTKQKTKNQTTQRRDISFHERPHLSRATIAVAKRNLEEFKSQSDEGFLIRADMNRKLDSL